MPSGGAQVDNRRVLNCVFWVLRSGSCQRSLLEPFGSITACCNRFFGWTKGDG